MKLSSAARNSRKVKAAVFCAGLLAALTSAELCLRLAGVTLEAGRERRFIPPYDEGPYEVDYAFERFRGGRGAGVVLALGDSLTNSGNVRSYESFPYHLFRVLGELGRPSAVYNLGRCEDSTFGARAKLLRFLADPKNPAPAAVVILAGAADLYNLPLAQRAELKEGGFWHDPLPSGLFRLRLYKVYRHLKLAWRLRPVQATETGGTPEEDARRLARLLELYAEHKKGLGGNEHRPLEPAFRERVRAEFGDYLRRAGLELETPTDFIDDLLLDYASLVYSRAVRYDELFALALDIARIFPRSVWTDNFDKARYLLVQTYQVQSKFTAAAVLSELDAAAAAHPEIARRGLFQNFRRLLTDREALDRSVDRRRARAWEEIVRACRERGITLVLQNYPVEYPGPNRVLEAVAAKHGLPLVDNRALFAGLISRQGRARFIEDNDHLTPLGYEIMARNAARALGRAGFAPPAAARLDPLPEAAREP